jgi:hypothetical protein
VAGDDRAAGVRRPDGLDQRGRGRGAERVARQQQHEVAGGEPVEPVLRRQRQAEVGAHRAGPVAAQGQRERRQAVVPAVGEHLGRRAEAEGARAVRNVRGDVQESGHRAILTPPARPGMPRRPPSPA